MKKNFGAKPFIFPQPVLIVSTYDAANHAYLRLGERVGAAFSDGEKLK